MFKRRMKFLSWNIYRGRIRQSPIYIGKLKWLILPLILLFDITIFNYQLKEDLYSQMRRRDGFFGGKYFRSPAAMTTIRTTRAWVEICVSHSRRSIDLRDQKRVRYSCFEKCTSPMIDTFGALNACDLYGYYSTVNISIHRALSRLYYQKIWQFNRAYYILTMCDSGNRTVYVEISEPEMSCDICS